MTLVHNLQFLAEMNELLAEVDAERGNGHAAVAEVVVDVSADDRRLAAVHLAHDNHLGPVS